MLGNIGDKLLPDMAAQLVSDQFDLYAAGLLGCPCGHQKNHAQQRDPARFAAAHRRYGA
jgi:hypothetical protein